MKKLVINKTSTRTSNNFNINDISISDYINPKYSKFNNIAISSESGKDDISENYLWCR